MSNDSPVPAGNAPRAERRWTASVFVLVAMAVPFLLPARYSPGTDWALPAIEGLVLLALIVVDPGRIDRPGRWVRALSIALVVVIAAGAAWGSARLTNATAFSPTDVMPLARWVKLTMSIQSLLSIVILSLVVANAVNLLG